MIEHCMQWGGEQRLRIRLTLDTAGGRGQRADVWEGFGVLGGSQQLRSSCCRPARPPAHRPLPTCLLPLPAATHPPPGGGDGSELEVQPLRVAVSREAWEGLPGSFTPDRQGAGAAEQQEASRQ